MLESNCLLLTQGADCTSQANTEQKGPFSFLTRHDEVTESLTQCPTGCGTCFTGPQKTQCFSLGLVFELHALKGVLRVKEGGEGVEGKKKPSQCICPSNLDQRDGKG